MKSIVFILALYVCNSLAFGQTPADVDAKINNIALTFKQNIFDKEACLIQKKKMNELIYEIEDSIEAKAIDSIHIPHINNLLAEATAITEYIGCIGNNGKGNPTLEQLYLANKRINGELSIENETDYCIVIIKIIIGDFLCLVGANKSTTGVTSTYGWQGNDKVDTGFGSAGIDIGFTQRLIDNRKNKLMDLEIYSMECREF